MADVCTIEDVQVDQDNTAYSYTVTYRLKLTTPTSDAVVAMASARAAGPNPLPTRMAAYPTDASAVAQKFNGRRLRDDNQANEYWVFRVTYAPLTVPPTAPKVGDEVAVPTARTTKKRLEFIDEQKQVTKAYNVTALVGRAAGVYDVITNAAKQLTQQRFYDVNRIPVLVATKNFATQDDVDALNRSFQGKVNDAAFYGRAAHYAKFLSADVTEEIREGSYTYYEGTIRIALGYEPWYWDLDNVGFQAWTLPNCTGLLLPWPPDSGIPEGEPRKLELDGRARAQDAEVLKVVYRPAEANFSTIGIGTAW